MNDLFTQISESLKIDKLTIYYYVGIFLKIVIIFALAKMAIEILNRIATRVFRFYPRFKINDKKSDTLLGILKSVIKYGVYIVMGISMLDTLGIPTQPILATAGLGGIAIGFGAQSLVRDVFTGFFILFEDQYGVGDYITINGVTGTVEEIGLRITRLRSFNGDLHIIPNGEIKEVTNVSRGNSTAIVDVGIAYESDYEKAVSVLAAVAADYFEGNKDKVAEKPEVLGIIKLGESDVIIRTIASTMPMIHWRVERDLRRLILEAFKRENIEIPYPKRVLIEKDR